MIRRLNYTKRRRIVHRDVAIRLSEADGAAGRVQVTLILEHYGFPADARVFVEAYRQTTLQRFDFGTIGNLNPPEQLPLTAFESADGVKFRVKVVEAAGDGDGARPARILGRADGIRPRSTAPRHRQSLLAVAPGDFDDEVWRLEFDEADAPLLKVSRSLAGDWRALPHTPEFVTLAIPAIFRQILTRIVLIEGRRDVEDGEDWRSQWLRFATQMAGSRPPGPDDPEDPDEWIDQAVSGLCHRISIRERFRRWQKDEG